MRTLKKTLLLFISIFIIQNALLGQTADLTEGCIPLSVQFTPPVGLASYFWDFQNNATSVESDPTAVFVEEGTYNVTLRETVDGSIVGTITINVYPTPLLSIEADPTIGCAPTVVNFSSTSTIDPNVIVNQYSWVFGGGSAGTGMSTNTSYSQPGIYTVSLSIQATQEGCSTTQIFPDLITLGGISNLSFFTIPTPAISCDPPLEIDFLNVTPPGLSAYTWDFGNGQTFEGIDPPNMIYSEVGDYSITLIAEDEQGCTATRQKTVRLRDPLANLNFPDTLCLEAFVELNELIDTDSVRWSFPPSASLHTDTSGIIHVVFHESGFQAVSLTSIIQTPFFCEKDTTFMVFIDEVIVSLASEPSYTCERELNINFTASSDVETFFSWNFFGMGFAEGNDVNHTYTYNDTTVYGMYGLTEYYTTLLAINPSGCLDTFILVDTIYPPNALFMSDVVSGCAPLTVTFADSSASFEQIIEWNFDYGDGFTETLLNDDNHSHTFTQEGTYEVTLNIVNEDGCRDTSYIRIIEVGTPLDIQFEYAENDVCIDDDIEFTLINPPEEIDWVHLMEPDTLHVFYNGCLTEIINPAITVHGPDVAMSYEIDCDAPFLVNFTSNLFDVETVFWDFGDEQTSSEENPIHVYQEVGDYWVKVTAFNTNSACSEKTDSLLVCIRDLEADFVLPESICANEILELDATNTNDANKIGCAGGFTWYFDLNGRPIQGNDTLLMHTFATPGREIVTLITKDINGCRDTLKKAMNIYSISPDFVVDDNFICMPATVHFMDLSVSDTTLVNWTWDFGDETTATTEGGASHTYVNIPAGAIIEVLLTLEDAQGCRVEELITINVYEPVSNIISDPSPLNICVGETIDFSGAQFTGGGSSLDFNWSFNGELPIDVQETSQTYNQPGSFPVNMHFVEVATGCQGNVEGVVNVQDYPVAAFTSSEDDSEAICVPAQISFFDASTSNATIGIYNWNFGNGDGSFAPDPTATFDRGMYTVNLTIATTFGCSDEISHDFEVVGPVGSFIFDAAAICEGESITFTLVDTLDLSSYSWDFGDGNAVDNVSPVTHAFDNIGQLGTFPVTLILRGAADQCVVDVTQNIQIHDVRADFSLNDLGETNLCAGEYQFINESTGADQYQWTFDDGSMSSIFEPTQTFSEGTYEITLVAENETFGCVDEITQLFEFFSPPGIIALGDTICPGDTAILNIIGVEADWDFVWTPGTVFFPSPFVQNPMVTLQESGNFQVQVTDSLGCISTDMVHVEVVNSIIWEDVDEIRCPGDSLNIELPVLNDLYNVIWSPNYPPDTIGLDDIDLTLTIEDKFDCFSDTYSFFIQSLSDSIALPNIFSPNGDGVNDVFRIFSEIDFNQTDLIVIKSFTVFNRWGQKVYEAAGPDARWDGNVDGNPAPSDVYIYLIQVDIPKSGRFEELKGSVTLVR